MIKDLLKNINERINQFTDISIISQDIDKNTIFPCFKTKIITNIVNLKSNTSIEYICSVSINYYPKQDLDKRIEFIEIQKLLSMIFMFDLPRWKVDNLEIIDNEDFIICNIDYYRLDIYEEPITIKKNKNSIEIVEKNNEYIENMELKEL